MTEQKSTPGPWEIPVLMPGEIWSFQVGGERPYRVAIVQKLDDKEEWTANARLIAAAPETAARLERLEVALKVAVITMWTKWPEDFERVFGQNGLKKLLADTADVNKEADVEQILFAALKEGE